MKGRSRSGFTPADFADNFHRSLDAALHREPVVVKPIPLRARLVGLLHARPELRGVGLADVLDAAVRG